MADLDSRFRLAYDHLVSRRPDGPAFEEIGEPLVRFSPGRGRRWTMAAVSAALILGLGAVVLVQPSFLAGGRTGEHLLVEHTLTVNLTCTGMDEIEDDGGPDRLLLEAWVDYDNQDARYEVRAPATGEKHVAIHQGGLGSSPPVEGTTGRPLGRHASCVRITDDGRHAWSATSPPFLPYPLALFMHPDESIRSLSGPALPVRLDTSSMDRVESRTIDSRGRDVTWFVHGGETDDGETPPRATTIEWALNGQGRVTERVHRDSVDGWWIVESRTVLVEVERGPLDPDLFDLDDMEHLLDREEMQAAGDPGDAEPVVTTTSIAPLGQPLMEDAEEIEATALPGDLRPLADPQPGDRLYRLVGTEAYVRLRPAVDPLAFGTCEVTDALEVPDGWAAACPRQD